MSQNKGQPKPLPDDFPHVQYLRSAGLETWTHLSQGGFIQGRSFTEIDGVGTSRAKEIARWMCETEKLKDFHVTPGEDRMSVHVKPKTPPEEADGDQMPDEPDQQAEGQPPQQEDDGAQPPPEAQGQPQKQQAQQVAPEASDEPAQGSVPPEEDPATQPQQDSGQGEPDPEPPPEADRNDYTPEVSQNRVDSDGGIDMNALSKYFQPDEIEWRPTQVQPKQGYNQKGHDNFGKGRALALAYVTNRAIQNRLDEVVGPARWKNEFKPGPNGGVICGLSLYLQVPGGGYEWVTKWDGAENTNFEAVKGGLSDSMKRAGYQWGIGRYLYRLPTMWLDCKLKSKGGGNVGFKEWIEEPELPPNFLPKKGDKLQRDNPERRRAEKHFHAAGNGFYGDEWDAKREWVISTYAKKNGFHADSTHDLTTGQLDELAKRMKAAKKKRQQQQRQQQQPQQQQRRSQQGAPQGRQKGGGGNQGQPQGQQQRGGQGGQGSTQGPQQGDFGAFDNPEEDLPSFGDAYS